MKIHFEEIGIDQEIGDHTIKAIKAFILKHPGRSIELRTIAEDLGFPGDKVKDVFFALLSLRYLKPTFLPRHKKCNCAIGKQEQSIFDIKNKIDNGEYNSICLCCNEEIEGIDDLDIQIIFWKGRDETFD